MLQMTEPLLTKKNVSFETASNKQKLFLESKKRYCLLSGSVRAGKTFAGCLKGFLLNLMYPGNRGLICRKEARSIPESTLRTLLERIIPPEMIVQHNLHAGFIVHRTLTEGVNSTIVYSGLDKGADQSYPTKIGSTAYGWIFFDETIEGDEGDWLMLSTRLEYKIPQLSHEENKLVIRQLFGATNPDVPSHWLYKFFFESDSPDREVFFTTLYENKFLDQEYIKGIEATLTGITKKRLLLGQWVQAEGVVYDVFDPNKHVIDDTGLLRFADYQEFISGADENFPLPRASLLIGIRGDGRRDVIDEFYVERSTIEELRSWLESQAERVGKNLLVFHDPSGAEAIKKLNDSPSIFCEKAKNEVNAGISTVHGLFASNQLFVHKRCVNFIRELLSYHWKRGSEGERPEKKEDHLCDSARYALFSYNFEVGISGIGGFIR